MNDEYETRLLIERNLAYFAEQGVPRKPGDLDACYEYRRSLTSTEQQIFDTLLREGNYAGSSAELLEIYVGRKIARSPLIPSAVATTS